MQAVIVFLRARFPSNWAFRSAALGLFMLVALVETKAESQVATNAAEPPVDEVIPSSSWTPRFLKVPLGPRFIGQVVKTPGGGEEYKKITVDELRQALEEAEANQPEIRNRAQQFYVADAKWLQSFMAWYTQRLKDWHIHFQKEVFDCDDYSTLMAFLADVMSVEKKDYSGMIMIGRLTVKSVVPWGGIPAGGTHELVVVATNRGLQIIEPQNGKITPLTDYPNRENIERIILP